MSSKLDALLRRCACSSAPEAAFWKGVVANLTEASPNWGLDLNASRTPLSVDAFVYLVDTSNLWLASAAISPDQLARPLDEKGVGEGDASPERARAARCIAAASATADSTASPQTLSAFAAALSAIAMSPGYAAAHARETPLLDNHHWILLLYRLAGGDVIAGLGHVDEPYPGMLDRGVLLECVESMVQMDLGSERTIVNQAVKRAGGVMLARELGHVKVA
jgi:hypothetical protein